MAIPYSECQSEALLHLPWFSRGHRLIFLEPSEHPQHQPTTEQWILERACLGKAYAVNERNSTTCREKLYFLKSNRLKSPGNHYLWYLGQIKFHSGNWPGYQIARANQPTVWGWERMVIYCLSWFFGTKLWKVVGLEFSPSLFPLLQSLSHTCTHKRRLVINSFTYHDLQRLMIDFSFFFRYKKKEPQEKKEQSARKAQTNSELSIFLFFSNENLCMNSYVTQTFYLWKVKYGLGRFFSYMPKRDLPRRFHSKEELRSSSRLRAAHCRTE